MKNTRPPLRFWCPAQTKAREPFMKLACGGESKLRFLAFEFRNSLLGIAIRRFCILSLERAVPVLICPIAFEFVFHLIALLARVFWTPSPAFSSETASKTVPLCG